MVNKKRNKKNIWNILLESLIVAIGCFLFVWYLLSNKAFLNDLIDFFNLLLSGKVTSLEFGLIMLPCFFITYFLIGLGRYYICKKKNK